MIAWYFDTYDKLQFYRPTAWVSKALYRFHRSPLFRFVYPYLIVNMGVRGDYGTPLRPKSPLRGMTR